MDTTTIGAMILYGFASAAVFKVARQEGLKKDRLLGGICLVILGCFLAFLTFPAVFADHTIETETYALLTVWSMLGLIFFHGVIRNDHARNFGKAIIVWIALLAVILLTAITWSERVNEERENVIVEEIGGYLDGTADNATLAMSRDEFLNAKREELHAANNASVTVIAFLFGASLVVMLVNYRSMQKWEKLASEERDKARNVALTDPMTGVKSKHAFLLSQKEIDAAIEEGTAGEFAIVVCDVNGLKVIDDTYGHKAGDDYIIKASRMVCDIFQHSPVFRTGGDEFVALLKDRDYLIRNELVLALHDRSVEHIGTKEVVVSGGLSEYRPGEDTCFHNVFERADSLMYEEKTLLKGMGAATREDAEEAARTALMPTDNSDILRLKRHVLIVEDEQVNQKILGNMLEGSYDVLYASDGVEALEQVKLHKDELALVLLDLQMPKLSGMDVLKVMKEEAELKDIPVVVMTADQSAEVELYRARLLEDFKLSLESGRFMVYYQPKFDIRPDKPTLSSAEALVRWDHPELGMISPGVFIPLLEDNGLILELDQFVWREVASKIRDWKTRFGYSVPVSVNVSRIDMLTPNLKGIFKEILEEYGLSADDLILEITESAYTGDSEQVISTAKDLRGLGMGFRIEMDDFGTGYSSLGMLSQLPIDVLKLDMSFIRNAFGETRDVRMIELIIDIADYLHVPVVAEGVETEEQYLVLKAMGCDLVQGYYFSKPVPPEFFDHFLIERMEATGEATPAAKKTSMNMSEALNSDFESIFYVDVATHFYLEFHMGEGDDFEISPGESDFFDEAGKELLKDVCEPDVEKVRAAISKANLMRWIREDEPASLRFNKVRDGQLVPYLLQTIKTRESDGYHIVIGVRPE